MNTLILLTSGSIIVLHMIFKELHNTFGKLMILYNIAKICEFADGLALFITHHHIILYSPMHCYLFYFLLMQASVASETFAISLPCLYYALQLQKSREVTKEINKKFYKCAISCVLGLLLLFNIFLVSYDFGSGTYL